MLVRVSKNFDAIDSNISNAKHPSPETIAHRERIKVNNSHENASSRLAADRILSDPNAKLALSTIAKLSSAGYIAYLAGGCVRDALMGRIPKDYDVATDARPEQIQALFGKNRTIAIGASFGVISVLGSRAQGDDPVEVATFRSDGVYSDGRRPDTVQFCSPEQDAQRRDFTINGMFFDPAAGNVIDFVHGIDDLAAKQVRAIRDPDQRFQEDKLRLLRAVRFAATYQFQLEQNTLDAIQRSAADVTVCSGERIGAEMIRILADPTASTGLCLLMQTKLADAAIPEIASTLAEESVLKRICQLLDYCESYNFPARLALLLSSDPAHASPNLTRMTKLWHLSNELRDATLVAIDDAEKLLQADNLKWSELQPLLVKRYSRASVAAVRAMSLLESHFSAAVVRINLALQLPPEQLDPPPLLTGNDLIQMGLNPGPEFKRILQTIRNAQLDGEIARLDEAKTLVNDQLKMK